MSTEEVRCPKCGRVMVNEGNLSGIVYTSYPPQWNDTYVCHHCRVKKVIRKHGKLEPDKSYLEDYENG